MLKRRRFVVLEFAGCHADVIRALDGGGHARGGIGGLQFDIRVRVDGLVRLDQLLHHRRHGGRTADDQLAFGAIARVSRRVVAADIAVLVDDGLALGAHDVGDEVLGKIALAVRLIGDVERARDFVAAVRDVLRRRLNAFPLHGLHGFVQRTEGDIADRLLVARDGHQHGGGVIGDLRVIGGHIDLFAVDLLLHARQLDERAARAGAFLAGNHGDGLIRVEIGAGGRGNAGQGKRGQRRDFGDFVHDVFSSFYTFFQ